MPPYTTADLDGELRQSEIITGLVQYTYDPVTNESIETPHDYAIVLSQDCDLLRDFEAQNDGRPLVLNGVLLFELEPGTFRGPHGLMFDSTGALYVADTGNGVVRKFRLLSN